jgi:serine/threonine protein kinase
LFIFLSDLKPQNIGFDADKTLKLFDFGLAACVQKKRTASDTYDMTGYTGTLVYMAPEVVLRKHYNEKVDVYSFAILLWQMLSGEDPFGNMTKDDHMKLVVLGGQRPHMSTITSRTPVALQNLLTRCWHADYLQRPDFATIAKELTTLKRNPKPFSTTPSSRSSSSSSSIEVNKLADDSKKEKSPSVDTTCSEDDCQMESPVRSKPTTITAASAVGMGEVASGVNRRRRGFNTLLFKF